MDKNDPEHWRTVNIGSREWGVGSNKSNIIYFPLPTPYYLLPVVHSFAFNE